MCLLVTGAAGFVGQAVSRRLSTLGSIGKVRLIDRHLPDPSGDSEARQVDLLDTRQLKSAVDGVTRVIHLASLAGGASEADPAASRAINLEASLNLLEALAASGRGVRFVYTSSIAVFGQLEPRGVDDTSLPAPTLTYGTHKLMMEHAIADATRRGVIDGISIRLPGIVARPSGNTSFKSAFLSELFWAIQAGRPYEVPVSPTATTWLLSIEACVTAILHAAFVSIPTPLRRGITLPALRVTIADLIAEIGRRSDRPTTHITYRPDPGITANFGAFPPLSTETADRMGFLHDGDVTQLVSRSVESALARASG